MSRRWLLGALAILIALTALGVSTARAQPPSHTTIADILLIDNDGSQLFPYAPDYARYYTPTLEALGYSYEYWDAETFAGHDATIPDAATLSAYKAVIYFTGDNFISDSVVSASIPLTMDDVARLTEYMNAGGALLATGQDLASVLGSATTDGAGAFYGFVLGGNWLQDSVTGENLPSLPILPTVGAPAALQGVRLSLAPGDDGAGNQVYIDEIAPAPTRAPGDPQELTPFQALFYYPGGNLIDEGIVSMAHRDQPRLERPSIAYLGRSVYTAFGLEGVNNEPGFTSRGELVELLLSMLWDEPSATIHVVTPPDGSGLTTLWAELLSEEGATGVAYRWDLGDGSELRGPYTGATLDYQFPGCGPYVVRVEVTDSLGNTALASRIVYPCRSELLMLPLVIGR